MNELHKLTRLVQWLEHCNRLVSFRQQWNQLSRDPFGNQPELFRIEKEIGWQLVEITP